jgi:hypothetical protein
MTVSTTQQNVRKLRESHIPPYTFRTNFDQEQLGSLKARITSAEFRDAMANGAPVNLFIYAGEDHRAALQRSVRAAALVAKGLCLQNMQVIHTHMAGFLREQRMAEMERTDSSVNPVLSHLGKGYIAISDFLEYDNITELYGHHSLQLIADYLIEHVEAGGGLILGAGNIDPLDVLQFGVAFQNLMGVFETYRV